MANQSNLNCKKDPGSNKQQPATGTRCGLGHPHRPEATTSDRHEGLDWGARGGKPVDDELRSIAYQTVAVILIFFVALFLVAEGGFR